MSYIWDLTDEHSVFNLLESSFARKGTANPSEPRNLAPEAVSLCEAFSTSLLFLLLSQSVTFSFTKEQNKITLYSELFCSRSEELEALEPRHLPADYHTNILCHCSLLNHCVCV